MVQVSIKTKSTVQQLFMPISLERFKLAALEASKTAQQGTSLLTSVTRVDNRGKTEEQELDGSTGLARYFGGITKQWNNTLRISVAMSKPATVGAGIEVTTIECDRSRFWAARRLVVKSHTQSVANLIPE